MGSVVAVRIFPARFTASFKEPMDFDAALDQWESIVDHWRGEPWATCASPTLLRKKGTALRFYAFGIHLADEYDAADFVEHVRRFGSWVDAKIVGWSAAPDPVVRFTVEQLLSAAAQALADPRNN